MKYFKNTLLLLAGAALLAPSVRAQDATVSYPANGGQLLLGFRETNNTNNDLFTNLGAVSTFDSLQLSNPGAVINVNTGNYVSGGSGASGINGIGGLGADLTSLYGTSSWSALTDSTTWNSGNRSVLFSAIGVNGSTVYVTNTSATPYTPSSAGSQNGVHTAVNTLGNGSYDGNTSTDNSNFNVLAGGAYSANTFHGASANAPGSDFTLYPSSAAPGSNASFEGPQNLTLYLDREVAGAASGIELGFFSLDNAGDLTFTVAAVPEPATWASAILVVLALVGVTAKRRFASAAKA